MGSYGLGCLCVLVCLSPLGTTGRTVRTSVSDTKYKDGLAWIATLAEERLQRAKHLVSSEGFKVCGDGYCLCRGTLADCSSTFLEMTYIPRLPAEVRELNATWNLALKVNSADFFHNVTNITSLDLAFCRLHNMSRAAFLSLHNLTTLNVSSTGISYADFSSFHLDTLEMLYAENTFLGPLPNGLFNTYPFPSLQSLYLRGNRLGPQINMTDFQPLTNLKELFVDNNGIWKVVSDYLPHLEWLDAGLNSLSELWETCRHNTSLFPNLSTIIIPFNVLSNWDIDLCLPKLKLLLLGENGFHLIATKMFNSQRFPELEVLSLDSMRAPITAIQSHAFDSPVLAVISIADNNLDFASNALVHEDSFAGCPNLRGLSLSANDLSSVSADRFLRLWGHLVHLRKLRLPSCNMRNISSIMLARFTNLVWVDLSYNRLVFIPDGSFDNMAPGAQLSLQNNQIGVVQETAFTPTLRQTLNQVDLSKNPFQCSCDLRWFQDWLATNPALFGNLELYKCDNLPTTDVASFFVEDQACLLSRQTSVLIITIALIITISFTLLTTIYRYRWHLRLVVHEAFKGRGHRQQRFQQLHFDYDVFVSYDSDDRAWVYRYLKPRLEDDMGLRLCLHERDFLPGKTIVENIDDCMQSSKKYMMAFSVNFASSRWCQYELELGRTCAVDNDDALPVVLLGDIPSRDLTAPMIAVMKTTTYIEWGDEPDAMESFWRRMAISLAELLPVV